MKILLLTILLLATNLFANIGKITAVKGDASVTREAKVIPINLGFILQEKDQIKTGKNSRLQLQFNDKTIISLGKESVFNVEEYFFDEQQPQKTKASFKMAKGVFKSITGRIGKINPTKFVLKTKSASIGIRGTIFFGAVAPGQPDNIACTSGSIVVSTPNGFVEVPAGQFTTVTPGEAPRKPANIPPAQKQKLEQDSGAAGNEGDSGENTEQTQNNGKPDVEAPDLEKPDVNDLTPQETPLDDPETPLDDPETPLDNPETPSDDPIETGKTATYSVFQSGILTKDNHDALADDNSYYQVLKENTYFNINSGALSGSSELHAYRANTSVETIYDMNFDGVADTLFYTLPNITLNSPTTTYTGFSQVYSNGTDTKLFADSKQQFFVGQTKYTQEIEIDSGVFETYNYEQSIVFGQKSNFDSIATSGISHYREAEIVTDPTVFATTNGSYINWASNSLLQYEIRDNDVVIVMGNVTEDEYEKAKLNLNFYQRKKPLQSDTIKINSTDSDMYLFGSNQQGWGGNIEVAQESTDNNLVYTHGEFKDVQSTSNTPTGSSNFQGFANISSVAIGDNLSLSLNRMTGITATINSINISGNYSSKTAGYITDDTFASLGFSGTYLTNNVTDGWIIALDTGSVYDDGSDDQISWGFWNMEYTESGTPIDIGNQAWVAAQDIVEDISSLGNSGIATYSGQAMGFLNDTTFIDPSKSTMGLSFDFGANTLQATLNINNVQTMTKNFTDISLGDNIYNTYNGVDGADEIKGSFANGGATTIGSYTFTDGSDVATGVYKTKQLSSTLSSQGQMP